MNLKKYLHNVPLYVPGVKKEGALKMASNENPLGPSPAALNALRALLPSLHMYPDGANKELKEALAHRYSIVPEQLILGNGSDELLQFTALACLSPGENTVAFKQTFSIYETATKLMGGTIRQQPFNNGNFSLDAMLQHIDASTRIAFVCNPNNPTGTYLNEAAIKRFMDAVPAHVLVVIDEAYAEYATADDFPDTIKMTARYPNMLVLRTFSKLYGLAGLRLGYGIASPDIIQGLERVRMPFNTNAAIQAAAVAALNDTTFIAQSLQVNETGKAYLYPALKKIGMQTIPTQTNFIYFDAGRNAQEIFVKLMDLGVTIRPLTSFGFPQSLRVTVGTPEQNEFFMTLLEKVV